MHRVRGPQHRARYVELLRAQPHQLRYHARGRVRLLNVRGLELRGLQTVESTALAEGPVTGVCQWKRRMRRRST